MSETGGFLRPQGKIEVGQRRTRFLWFVEKECGEERIRRRRKIERRCSYGTLRQGWWEKKDTHREREWDAVRPDEQEWRG